MTDQYQQWQREGQQWVEQAERFDAMNDGFGRAMLDAAGLSPGQRVLDIGCGNGATTLQAAERVAPGGTVVGLDISAPMLAYATRRAAEVDAVTFVDGDAKVYTFDEPFDAVVSRFGTMFFDDMEAAFTNLHRATGGRLSIVCWQDVLASEWTAVPGGTAAAHLGFPDFGEPGAPGPYALADEDRLASVLKAGGFHDIEIEGITCSMLMGADVDDVVAWFTSLDIVSTWFAQHPADKVAAATADVRTALEPFAREGGVVMNGSAWLATAVR